MAEALPAAARDTVERVRLNFRDWAPAQQRPPSLAGPLPGGQSNLTLLLRGDGEGWVLRIPRRDPPIGVCYAREHRLHALAAAQRLAPAIVLAEPDTGLLLTSYLAPDQGSSAGTGNDGDPGSSAAEDRDESGRATVAAIARLLRAIHSLDHRHRSAADRAMSDRRNDTRAAIDLSLLNPATELARLRRGLGYRDPLRDLAQIPGHCLAHAAERSAARSGPGVICHNDLLSANRLTHRGRLVAIDWEYARPGDAFFDLAVVASELDSAGRAALLASYLQRDPTAQERRQFLDQSLLYTAIAACWYTRHGSANATRSAIDLLVTLAKDESRSETGAEQ